MQHTTKFENVVIRRSKPVSWQFQPKVRRYAYTKDYSMLMKRIGECIAAGGWVEFTHEQGTRDTPWRPSSSPLPTDYANCTLHWPAPETSGEEPIR